MAITFIEQNYPIRRVLSGSDSLEVDANTVIKFRVGNVEILDEKVPVGKVWRLNLTIKIEEQEAK